MIWMWALLTYIFCWLMGWVMGFAGLHTVEAVPFAVLVGILWGNRSPWILRSIIRWRLN